MKMHGIFAPDRAREQPLGVDRVRRADHLQAGDVGEERLGRLRVVVPAPDAAADRRAHHHRAPGTRRPSGTGTWPARSRSDRRPGRRSRRTGSRGPGASRRGPCRSRCRRCPTPPAACRCSDRGRTPPAGRPWRGRRRRTGRRPRPARRRADRGASRPSRRHSRPGRGSSPALGVFRRWPTTVFRARWQVEADCAAAQAGVPAGARSL